MTADDAYAEWRKSWPKDDGTVDWKRETEPVAWKIGWCSGRKHAEPDETALPPDPAAQSEEDHLRQYYPPGTKVIEGGLYHIPVCTSSKGNCPCDVCKWHRERDKEADSVIAAIREQWKEEKPMEPVESVCKCAQCEHIRTTPARESEKKRTVEEIIEDSAVKLSQRIMDEAAPKLTNDMKYKPPTPDQMAKLMTAQQSAQAAAPKLTAPPIAEWLINNLPPEEAARVFNKNSADLEQTMKDMQKTYEDWNNRPSPENRFLQAEAALEDAQSNFRIAKEQYEKWITKKSAPANDAQVLMSIPLGQGRIVRVEFYFAPTQADFTDLIEELELAKQAYPR